MTVALSFLSAHRNHENSQIREILQADQEMLREVLRIFEVYYYTVVGTHSCHYMGTSKDNKPATVTSCKYASSLHPCKSAKAGVVTTKGSVAAHLFALSCIAEAKHRQQR